MLGFFLTRLVLVALLSAATLLSPASAEPSAYRRSASPGRAQLAQLLLQSPRVRLLDYHVSGVRDSASARQNLLQTARGIPAKRSYYGRGRGGVTKLSLNMLRALVVLTREGHSFRITELAGGSHCSNSRHYLGVAFDIDYLNGQKISSGHPTYRRFMQLCRELGATEVFGPGTRGHHSHVHIAWPRP
jgi:hypothetical protein